MPETQPSQQPKKKIPVFSVILISAFVLIIIATAISSVQKNQTTTESLSKSLTTVTISEAELNQAIAQELQNQDQNTDGFSSVIFDIEENNSTLTAQWTDGQLLTADIVQTNNNSQLIAENVQMSGAGNMNSIIALVAQKALNAALANITNSNELLLEQVLLRKDEVVLQYKTAR